MSLNHRSNPEQRAAVVSSRPITILSKLLLGVAITLASVGTGLAQSADKQDDLDKLRNFTSSLSTFSAAFEQTVYDADSNPLQNSTGTASLKRPGKFLWHYKTPTEQKIIADGEKVWIYDIELDQVTVSALDERASGTPLALLMGDSPLEDEFSIKAQGEADGIAWFELVPNNNDTDFEKIFLGLDKAGLAVMELRDNFGQATQIRFENYQGNIPLDDVMFDFKPPAGVDVIGEG